MSILESLPTSQASREQKLRDAVDRIKSLSFHTFKQLIATQQEGIVLVWNNQDFTPQEIIDALGPDAIKIFQYHGIITEAIVGISTIDEIAPDILLPTNAFTVVDNTITVLDAPYTP